MRLWTGPPGRLLDIGAGGMAAEFPARLLPGPQVRALVTGPGGTTRVSLLVVWCGVARISADGITYRAGLAFVTCTPPGRG